MKNDDYDDVGLWKSIYIEFHEAIRQSLAHDHSPLTFGEYADDLAMMKRVVLFRAVTIMPTDQFRRMLLNESPMTDMTSNESLWLAFDDEAAIKRCLHEHIARNNAG